MSLSPAAAKARPPASSSQALRHRTAVRALLAFVAVSALFTGGWATLSPSTFYTSFPLGSGSGWVRLAGPSSAHLTADVGAFYLAFALLFGWATWRPDRALVTPLCVAWSLFSLLHFGWHALHLDPFTTSAAIQQMVSLAVVLALPAMVLALARPTVPPSPPTGRVTPT
jgi:hypothetical protein